MYNMPCKKLLLIINSLEKKTVVLTGLCIHLVDNHTHLIAGDLLGEEGLWVYNCFVFLIELVCCLNKDMMICQTSGGFSI